MKRTILLLLAATCVLTVGAGSRALSEEDIWTLEPKEGGYEIEEFFQLIAKETDHSILFDPQSPQIARKKIEFAGVQKVPRARIFSWFRSMLMFQRLVLVPVGLSGGKMYMAVDTNSPQVTTRPVFVPEAELHKWADEDGAYIVTTIGLEHLVDTARARNALAQLSTRQVGRINDVPGARAFVVGDFAPVVWSMENMLREMDTKASAVPLEVPNTTGRRSAQVVRSPVPSSRIDHVARYEDLLTRCQTEAAAQYFVSRIRELKAAKKTK